MPIAAAERQYLEKYLNRLIKQRDRLAPAEVPGPHQLGGLWQSFNQRTERLQARLEDRISPEELIRDELRHYYHALQAEQARYEADSFQHVLSLGESDRAGSPSQRRDALNAALTAHYSPAVQGESQDLLEFVRQHGQVVLLGEAGSGKSNGLRRLALSLLEPYSRSGSASSSPDLPLIPIYAPLNAWYEYEYDLPRFVQSQLDRHNVPVLSYHLPRLLEEGRALVLLDGLNELPHLRSGRRSRMVATALLRDQRVRSIMEVGRAGGAWENGLCLLSCRSRDFASYPNWPLLYVQPLSYAQVQATLRACYAADQRSEQLLGEVTRRLFDANGQPRRQSRSRMEAAPYFLLRLAAYYYRRGALPGSPAHLIEFCVEELLQRQMVGGQLSPAQAEELRERLALLSFNMTEAGRQGATSRDRAKGWITGFRNSWREQAVELNADLLMDSREKSATPGNILRQALEAGLLVKFEEKLQFYHPAVQEYFCARFLLSYFTDSEVLEKSSEPRFRAAWQSAGRLDPWLPNRLANLLRDNQGETRECAALLLGVIGDENSVPPLLQTLTYDTHYYARVEAAYSLANLGDRRALTALAWPAQNDLGELGNAARKAIQRIRQRLGYPEA